jgi:hypothetical protein
MGEMMQWWWIKAQITVEQNKLLQQVCRTFLNNTQPVDCTMLHALKE